MNNKIQFYGRLCFFWICMFLILTPTPSSAAPTGEIMFVHPVSQSEIWISNLEGTTARKYFNQKFGGIEKIELQDDGDYVLVVANRTVFEGQNIQVFFGSELFILDRQHPRRKAKNLTLERIIDFVDADISKNGDVVFIRHPGIRIIRNEELTESEPKIELLFDAMVWNADLFDIEWSPDGKQIAFTKPNGLFLLDVATKDVFQITEGEVYSPVFSPNGKQIAYETFVQLNGNKRARGIVVVPVQPNADPVLLQAKEGYSYNVNTWSPDGKYIAYTSYIHHKNVTNLEQFRSQGNFIIPATGGEPEPILITMKFTVFSLDWDNKAYPVEPADSFVTTWGKLKEQK